MTSVYEIGVHSLDAGCELATIGSVKTFNFQLVVAAEGIAKAWVIAKDIAEVGKWLGEHSLLAALVLLAVGLVYWVYQVSQHKPVAIYLVEPCKGSRWVHRSIEGSVLGTYSSKRQAVQTARRYHTGHAERAVLYVRRADGTNEDSFPFS